MNPGFESVRKIQGTMAATVTAKLDTPYNAQDTTVTIALHGMRALILSCAKISYLQWLTV